MAPGVYKHRYIGPGVLQSYRLSIHVVSTVLRGAPVTCDVAVVRGAVESTTPPPGSSLGEPEMY